MSSTPIVKTNEAWTTSKLALVVVLGAINGALSTPIALAWVALNNAFGVIGAALFQPFVIFASMAGWLLPRPGVFLLSMVVSGFANMLTGDPSGVVDVYWGVAGGLAGEIAGLIFRWNPKKSTQIVLFFCRLFIPLNHTLTAFFFGWQPNLLFWGGLSI